MNNIQLNSNRVATPFKYIEASVEVIESAEVTQKDSESEEVVEEAESEDNIESEDEE